MLSKPRQSSIAVSGLILVSILFSSCGALSGLGSGGKNPSPPDLPAPPPIPQTSAAEPARRAAELANLIAAAANDDERLGAWLAVYQAVGIPVLDEEGTPVTATGEDPVGAPYWQVWYASGLNEVRRGISLVDAGKILSLTQDMNYDPDAGRILLSDLRAAAVSSDPYVQLLGLFIRERIYAGPSRQDLMDVNLAPDSLIIDLASVQLLSWALFRGEAFAIVTAASTKGSLHLASQSRSNSQPEKLFTTFRCAEMFGSEEATAVVNFIFNTFYQGLDIPQTNGLKGMIERGMEMAGVSEDRIGQIKKIQGGANAIAAVLSFAMQLRALEIEVDASGGPLERYRERKQGKEKSIDLRLFYDPKKAQGDKLWACMASFLSSNLGVNFKLPSAEAISGAEITVKPGRNIPDKVLFNNASSPSMVSNGFRYTTNSNGTVTVEFTGRARDEELPESASQFDDTFTVIVSAQPEGVSGSSIFSMFWDSFAFWSKPNPVGIVAPMVDFLKTLSYELGEVEILMTDWRVAAYRAEGQISGIFCPSAPSTLTGGGGFIFDFKPSTDKTGSMSYTFDNSLMQESGCVQTGVGDYTVALSEDKATGVVTWTASGMMTCPEIGSAQVFSDTKSFNIRIDPEASCD